MSRRRTIKYGIDQESNFCISQVGDEVAYAMIEFDKLDVNTPGWGAQSMPYHLEKVKIWQVAGMLGPIKWTRFVPLAVKNEHRRFWGLKPLPVG